MVQSQVLWRHIALYPRIIALLFGFACVPCSGFAGTPSSADSSATDQPSVVIRYGGKGLEFGTRDGKYLLQIESRLQFRYATPGDSDPITFDDFDDGDQHDFKINRARLKVGGHAYQSWLKYYWEYELAAGNLLDFRVMLEKLPTLNMKIGQWKAQYNRERIISSGKQQMVERSLINRPFTIDRQQGISLFGHLKGPGVADFNYWLELLTGTGRGSKTNDDQHPMWMFRGQWNAFGRPVKFAGSALEPHDKPAALIALGAVTNRSPYTRFSQAGGGDLEGFEPGEPGQYRVHQAMLETAFMYKGFSWQQELHWKEVNDLRNTVVTVLTGNYAQAGCFFHGWLSWVPEPLEVAARHAVYVPNRERLGEIQNEYTLALNWFFAAHRNKLTAELSHIDFRQSAGLEREGLRFRLQWDVSM